MKFEELRGLCDVAAWIIIVQRPDGTRERTEISRDYTADAREKLARYDGADIVRIRSYVTQWPQGPVNTLEVVLNV